MLCGRTQHGVERRCCCWNSWMSSASNTCNLNRGLHDRGDAQLFVMTLFSVRPTLYIRSEAQRVGRGGCMPHRAPLARDGKRAVKEFLLPIYVKYKPSCSHVYFFFRPPVCGSNGRSYEMLVMFFFSPRVIRVPSTDRPETLPPDRNLHVFDNTSPKIRGALPQKNSGAKNMHNFGRFWTTSDFDREYLRNG